MQGLGDAADAVGDTMLLVFDALRARVRAAPTKRLPWFSACCFA